MSFYALSSKPLLRAKLSATKERGKKEFFVPLPNSITTMEKSLRRELKGIQGMGVSGAWREHMLVVMHEEAIGWPSVLLRLEGCCCFLFCAGG
ncbi:hypothetical protein ES288_A09G072500v1 [Gossypium darwinii]|uniref:Uncharacterized protein n=1 Tax=Gossypium darwinii TaxID=34276 RepID=A0A5D2F6D8_GOSDA|nr:hypothetical protein ES288_A09G072500v1 [Gossypium darwinii]